MNRTLLGLLSLALLMAPAASAADATFTDEPVTIPPGGSVDLPVTVTIDCTELFPGGSLTVPVSTSGLPDWMGAGTAEAAFSPTDCLTGEVTASKVATLTFDPTDDAMGLDPYKFSIVVGEGSFEFTGPIQVGYRDGHAMSTDLQFPYTLTDADGGKVSWNITIDVDANSQTMVMFQNLQTSVGKLSGVNHQIFDVETGDASRTITATFEAPSFEWQEATITFWNYSHCLKGEDCPPLNNQNVTWVITNGASGTPLNEGGGKDSPGLAPIGLSLALVAAALLARRRA